MVLYAGAPTSASCRATSIIAAQFARAVLLRCLLFGLDRPAAIRLFTGESEDLPASPSIAPAEFVLVQWLSTGALGWRDELYDGIEAAVKPRGIYEQRRLRPLGGQTVAEPAVQARGDEAPLEIVVDNDVGASACRFGVDVTAPLGVGPSPDMRLAWADDRRAPPPIAVCSICSRTPAHSRCTLAKAGAREDRRRRSRAGVCTRARACSYELLEPRSDQARGASGRRGEAVERFAERGRRFDIIICHPPTFSHGPAGEFSVARDLPALAATCASVLEPDGLLPCSRPTRRRSRRRLRSRARRRRRLAGADLRVIARILMLSRLPRRPSFPDGSYRQIAICVRPGSHAALALGRLVEGLLLGRN